MGIEVDSAVFASDGSRSNERVIVVGASDPNVAGLALARAGERFYSVAEDGRELSPEEAEEAMDEDLYTPNYVQDVCLASRGPWTYVDSKGWIGPAMRERMIAILVEELERAGVMNARLEVPSEYELTYKRMFQK